MKDKLLHLFSLNFHRGWPWLCFPVAFALLAPIIWQAWTIVGPDTYAGADGKTLQTQIKAFQHFATMFEINAVTPIYGFAGFNTPVNVWGNPVLWPFFFNDPVAVPQTSTMIAYFALAAAVFALGRRLGLPV